MNFQPLTVFSFFHFKSWVRDQMKATENVQSQMAELVGDFDVYERVSKSQDLKEISLFETAGGVS